MKTCSECNRTKELKEYQPHSGTIDGKLSMCKQCKNKEILRKSKSKGQK